MERVVGSASCVMVIDLQIEQLREWLEATCELEKQAVAAHDRRLRREFYYHLRVPCCLIIFTILRSFSWSCMSFIFFALNYDYGSGVP